MTTDCCRNSENHFVLAKIDGLLNQGSPSRYPATTESSKWDNSDFGFSNKNKLNIFAVKTVQFVLYSIFKFFLNFHHCILLSIKTPFPAFLCFVIILISQL